MFDFVVQLAMAAREVGHRLERPMECYQLCSNFLHQTIEEELVGASCADLADNFSQGINGHPMDM